MAEESTALRDARKYVKEFVEKFGNDVVSRARVGVQRAFVIYCRKICENCTGNLSWMIEKKPSYWPADLAFADPNNDKKNKDDLRDIVNFLVGQAKLHILSTPAQSRAPESSSAASGHQDSGAECRNWTEEDLRKRIKNHLHLFSSLDLDIQLNNRLLAIVDKWTLSQLRIKGDDLDQLISKLKSMLGKNRQLADDFRKQLQEFADEESFVLSTLPAPVHQLNCEEERCEAAFDNEMCANETMDEEEKTQEKEEKTQEEEEEQKTQEKEQTTQDEEEKTQGKEEKTQEEEKSAEHEMELPDRGNDNSWRSTMESDPDDSEHMVEEFNLQEDMETEIISSDSVECVNDEDENCDFSCHLLGGNVVDLTTEEQTLGPGSQDEVDDCEVAQKLLDEVCESFMGPASWKDLQKVIMDEQKASGVPDIPPNAWSKVVDDLNTLSVPDIPPNG